VLFLGLLFFHLLLLLLLFVLLLLPLNLLAPDLLCMFLPLGPGLLELFLLVLHFLLFGFLAGFLLPDQFDLIALLLFIFFLVLALF